MKEKTVLQGPTETYFDLLRKANEIGWAQPQEDRDSPDWLATTHPDLVFALLKWKEGLQSGMPVSIKDQRWRTLEQYLRMNLK